MPRAWWTLTLVLLGCSNENARSSPGQGGQGGSDAEADRGADVADERDGTTADGTSHADGAHAFVPDRGCQTAADCSDAGTCGRFGDTGAGVCVTAPRPATQCAGQGGDCCTTTDCERGTCIAVTTQPVLCSGTAGFDVRNRCLTDDCASDGECPTGSVCTPPGFELRRSCIEAGCRSDADCRAESGGACVLIGLGCVGGACSDVQSGCCVTRIGGGSRRPAALACVYPSDGCQSDRDCPGAFCTIAGGRARCTSTCQ
jgi:hypothetical protein